jgi:hypothetical protein
MLSRGRTDIVPIRAGLSQFCQIDRRKRDLGDHRHQMQIFTFAAALVFLAWATPNAQANETAAPTHAPQAGPLKPGRTAGVKRAQQARTGLALVGAGAIIAVVVVAAGSSGGNGNGAQNNMQNAPTTTSP